MNRRNFFGALAATPLAASASAEPAQMSTDALIDAQAAVFAQSLPRAGNISMTDLFKAIAKASVLKEEDLLALVAKHKK